MQETRDCDNCGSIVKHIPAGTSKKTGKPYNDFWACQNDSCSTRQRSPQTYKGSTQDGSQSVTESSTFEAEVMQRLATRLDSIDEKLDYLINKKEKTWMPNQSSTPSETQSPPEGSYPQENGLS